MLQRVRTIMLCCRNKDPAPYQGCPVPSCQPKVDYTYSKHANKTIGHYYSSFIQIVKKRPRNRAARRRQASADCSRRSVHARPTIAHQPQSTPLSAPDAATCPVDSAPTQPHLIIANFVPLTGIKPTTLPSATRVLSLCSSAYHSFALFCMPFAI